MGELAPTCERVRAGSAAVRAHAYAVLEHRAVERMRDAPRVRLRRRMMLGAGAVAAACLLVVVVLVMSWGGSRPVFAALLSASAAALSATVTTMVMLSRRPDPVQRAAIDHLIWHSLQQRATAAVEDAREQLSDGAGHYVTSLDMEILVRPPWQLPREAGGAGELPGGSGGGGAGPA